MVTAGDKPLSDPARIELKPYGSITGKVQPFEELADALVFLNIFADNGLTVYADRTELEADGRFNFESVPVAEASISINWPMMSSSRARVTARQVRDRLKASGGTIMGRTGLADVSVNKDVLNKVEIRFGKLNASIQGRVSLDDDLQPDNIVVNLHVTEAGGRVTGDGYCEANSGGEFAFPEIPAGTVILNAIARIDTKQALRKIKVLDIPAGKHHQTNINIVRGTGLVTVEAGDNRRPGNVLLALVSQEFQGLIRPTLARCVRLGCHTRRCTAGFRESPGLAGKFGRRRKVSVELISSQTPSTL